MKGPERSSDRHIKTKESGLPQSKKKRRKHGNKNKAQRLPRRRVVGAPITLAHAKNRVIGIYRVTILLGCASRLIALTRRVCEARGGDEGHMRYRGTER